MREYTQDEIDRDVPELDRITREYIRQRDAELAGDEDPEDLDDDWD